MIRYIIDKVSIKKTIIIGMISELIPLLISIPGVLILNPDGENYIPIMISIPILLIFHLCVVYIFYFLKKGNKLRSL